MPHVLTENKSHKTKQREEKRELKNRLRNQRVDGTEDVSENNKERDQKSYMLGAEPTFVGRESPPHQCKISFNGQNSCRYCIKSGFSFSLYVLHL